MNDGQRLGAAFMEANAFRIEDSTLTCTVSGSNQQEIGEEAVKICRAYFENGNFVITDLQTDALQTVTLDVIGYTARVFARAK